jgi:hypothetical protein
MIVIKERVVKIKAVDWGYYDDSGGYKVEEEVLKPYIGWIYGQVIIENDDYISIAAEVFEDSRVRKVSAIPKSAILEIIEFDRIHKENTF